MDLVEKAKDKTKELERRIAELQKTIDHQAELLSRRVPTFKVGKRKNDPTWFRVLIPDSHGSHIDKPAATAFLRDLELLRPREVVLLGDHADCGGFLAQHHTMGYVAETLYSFADDVLEANAFLDAVTERTPDADWHYIEGNHEGRLEKWIVTQTLRNPKDAADLKQRYGIDANLHLAKRGIHHYEQGKCYHGFSVPATIKLGNCVFTHGSVNAKNPAKVMLAKYATNVAFGHNHCDDHCGIKLLGRDVMAACCNSLCKQQPMWKHSDPSTWTHGYAVQIVSKSGMFLHINVRICDGVSLLHPMLAVVG